MFHIITISGMLGSGKSTVAKLLAQKLGYEYYSTGNAQREIAKKKAMTKNTVMEVLVVYTLLSFLFVVQCSVFTSQHLQHMQFMYIDLRVVISFGHSSLSLS